MNIHTPTDHTLLKAAGIAAITAATVAGATIDCRGYTRALVMLTSKPSGAATTSDAKIQSGAAADGSDAADVAGGGFTQVTTAGGQKMQGINVKILTNRYLTIPHTGAGGAAAGQFSIAVLLFNPGYAPVVQDVAPKEVTI